MAQIESVDIWKSRIAQAKGIHGRWWDKTVKYVDAYNGHWQDQWYDDDITSNWIRRVVDGAHQNLWFRAPVIDYPPIKNLDFKIVYASAALINQANDDMRAENAYRQSIFDALLCGNGLVKYGYHGLFPTEDEIAKLNTDPQVENDALLMHGKIPSPQTGEDHERHITVHNALLGGGGPQDQEVLKELIRRHGLGFAIKLLAHVEEHRRLLERERRRGRIDYRYEPKSLWCERVDPREYLIDTNVACIDDAEWIAFRIVRPVEDVQRDPALENTKNLEGENVPLFQDTRGIPQQSGPVASRFAVASNGGATSRDDDSSEKRVELWDIWSRKHEKRIIISEQCDKFHYNGDSPYKDIDGFFPCKQIIFSRPPSVAIEDEAVRAYGESVAAKFWTEQNQLNALHSLSLQITKHSVPRYIAKGAVDEEFLKAIEAGVPGGIGRMKDLNGVIEPLNLTGNTPDILQQINKLESIIQFKSGFSEVQLQGVSTARTATASQIQASSAGAVIDAMLSIIEDAFVGGCKITRALIKQFYTEERVIEILGDDGIEYVQATGADLIGSTWGGRMNVVTSSQGPAVNAMKLQRASYVYNLVSQSPFVKQRELLKWMFSQAGVPESPDFVYTDAEVAQMQQQAAMMQMMQQQAAQGGGAQDPNQANRQMGEMMGQPEQASPPVPPQQIQG